MPNKIGMSKNNDSFGLIMRSSKVTGKVIVTTPPILLIRSFRLFTCGNKRHILSIDRFFSFRHWPQLALSQDILSFAFVSFSVADHNSPFLAYLIHPVVPFLDQN